MATPTPGAGIMDADTWIQLCKALDANPDGCISHLRVIPVALYRVARPELATADRTARQTGRVRLAVSLQLVVCLVSHSLATVPSGYQSVRVSECRLSGLARIAAKPGVAHYCTRYGALYDIEQQAYDDMMAKECQYCVNTN